MTRARLIAALMLPAAFVAAGVAGCATKYQDMGFAGGVAAQQISADTFRIQARGNAYTNNATVQDYVLLKAAETARSVGASHFIILSSENAAMNRTEILISAALLITFIVVMRWALSGVLQTFGFETFMAVCGGGLVLILTAAYVVERRRGNLPRWLQPRATRPPPHG